MRAEEVILHVVAQGPPLVSRNGRWRCGFCDAESVYMIEVEHEPSCAWKQASDWYAQNEATRS